MPHSIGVRVDQYEDQDFVSSVDCDRSEMIRFVPQWASKILDVGCAIGNFGYSLKLERPVEIWGVEISEYAASIASQKLDRVICAPFDEKLELPENEFDCIVFNDVLEHLVDPYSALLYSKKLLKRNGVIVASIPNVRYFDNIWQLIVHKNWEYTEDGILDRTHLRFFTKRSVQASLNRLGYSIECIEGINSLNKNNSSLLRRFNFLNFLFLNQLEDMRYLQFAIVARP
jgi:2-polyprenyl-3-methyl-5-hydroxy-6-metoxy-1,4-benzoquinol methylase